MDQPDGSQSLIIDKAGSEDAGEYEVFATNSEGKESCKGQLEVAGKLNETTPEEKAEFLSPLHDMTIEEGEPLILDALFVGNPVPDIQWTKDSKPLKPSDRIMMVCDGKKIGLEINPSKVKDCGVYRCKIENALGSDSTIGKVTVKKVSQAPEFAQKFTDLQQTIGKDAKFFARVSGIPQPTISWFFNDAPIASDNGKYLQKRDGDAVVLYVKDCNFGDNGSYKCRATNKEGIADCEASLVVLKDLYVLHCHF